MGCRSVVEVNEHGKQACEKRSQERLSVEWQNMRIVEAMKVSEGWVFREVLLTYVRGV